MTSVTNGDVTTSYAFDALGERVKKSSPLSTTYFVYDEAGHLIGEYSAAGNIVEETVRMGDIPVATFANALLRAQLCRHGRAFEPPRYALDAPGRRAACASKVAVKRQPSWRL